MDFKVRTLVGLLFFFALMFFSVSSFSQPGGGGGRPCPRPPCPQTPISGIEILIAGGAMFGIKKLIKAQKPKL